MSRIDVVAGSLEYLDHGSGRPVVLLHGTGSSSMQWGELARRLSSRFHVFAPDLYGYGGTSNWPGWAPFRLAHEASLVGALLKQIGEPVDMIGHSYGGAVALHIARTQGPLLRSLALFEPAAFHLLRTGSAQDKAALREIAGVAAVIARSLESGDYAMGAEHLVDYWNGPGAWAAIPSARQRTVVARLAKVALEFEATIHEPASWWDLQGIEVPTLLMRSEMPTLPAQRMCLLLERALKRVRTQTIRGAGHMAPLTHGDEFNVLIVAHLEACSSGNATGSAALSA